VRNVYINLQQIYSGNYLPNFIRIARVLSKILQTNLSASFSPGHSVSSTPVASETLSFRNRSTYRKSEASWQRGWLAYALLKARVQPPQLWEL